MNVNKWILAAAAAAQVSVAGSAVAGIIDTAVPVLPLAGEAGKAVFTVAGVRAAPGSFSFVVHCTNADKVPVEIGVEVFSFSGAPLNDVAAGNGSYPVGVGETRTFATSDTLVYEEDELIALAGTANSGSARISATSSKILCSAQAMDVSSYPPPFFFQLPVVSKTKQKGD